MEGTPPEPKNPLNEITPDDVELSPWERIKDMLPESSIAVFLAMGLAFAGLIGVTKVALKKHFEREAIEWKQKVEDEKARIATVQALRTQKSRKAREAREAGGMRMGVEGELEQIDTGLRWTERDNGVDRSWAGSIDYCKRLKLNGGTWRLPTAAELQSLYKDNAETISCGAAVCKVSPLFELSREFMWTSESAGENLAWYVNLTSGAQYAESTRVQSFYRSLCVRSS